MPELDYATLISRVAAFTLTKSVTLEEIHDWTPDSVGDVIFQITRESAFSLLAEGVAIGKLHELWRSGTNLVVRTTFPIHVDTLFRRIPEVGGLGLLATAFGLALASKASSVLDSSGREVSDSLFSALWATVHKVGGVLPAGAKQYVLFRDPDYSIPQCLREDGRRTFPRLGRFRSLLARLGSEITYGKGLGASHAEAQLVTFLYEAALNSDEHASGSSGAVQGIRGIIIEKTLYHRWAGLDDRPQVPDLIKPYIRRTWENTEGDLMFSSYTVADLGPGIHRTLPEKANESSWDRLNRALLPGESRKPRGSGLSVGQGFTQILRAARDLRAFLFIRSAEMSGFKDFSRPAEQIESPLSRFAESMHGCVGSSVSLLWPFPEISPDQMQLFPGELESALA